jgi:hypothetical protein
MTLLFPSFQGCHPAAIDKTAELVSFRAMGNAADILCVKKVPWSQFLAAGGRCSIQQSELGSH